MLATFLAGRHDDEPVVGANELLGDDGVERRGQRRSGHHAQRFAGRDLAGEGAAREGGAGDAQPRLAAGRERFPLEMLVEEISISTNTAAAGGNASLMTIG